MREKLRPEVRALLEAIDAEGAPRVECLSPEDAREAAIRDLKEVGGAPAEVARVEDVEIPGPGGTIRLRVYTPEGEPPRPAMVYIHGGGWVLCDLDTHDVPCRAIARQAGAVVVSVEYRLAPEHKFPAAVEDAHAATVWVAKPGTARSSTGEPAPRSMKTWGGLVVRSRTPRSGFRRAVGPARVGSPPPIFKGAVDGGQPSRRTVKMGTNGELKLAAARSSVRHALSDASPIFKGDGAFPTLGDSSVCPRVW